MTNPTNPGEAPLLSDVLLFTAAGHTWSGQVSDGTPSSVASKLREAIKSLPCLTGVGIVDILLQKLDTIRTNSDALKTMPEILGKVATIRGILEKDGVLHTAKNADDFLVSTVDTVDIDTSQEPLENARRVHKNAQYLMIMYFTSKVLAILGQVSHQVKKESLKETKAVALVDAPKIILPQENTGTETHTDNETNPEKFLWCEIEFDTRMRLVPFLAALYLEGRNSISWTELKEYYKSIKGEEPTDANLYQLLHNIGVKFKGANKTVPFQQEKGRGINFVYTGIKPRKVVQTPDISVEPAVTNKFLDAPFDPQMFTQFQSFTLKSLFQDDIRSISDLNRTDKEILMVLLEISGTIHISELAQRCNITVEETNAYISHILQTLGKQGFAVRIESRDGYIKLINGTPQKEEVSLSLDETLSGIPEKSGETGIISAPESIPEPTEKQTGDKVNTPKRAGRYSADNPPNIPADFNPSWNSKKWQTFCLLYGYDPDTKTFNPQNALSKEDIATKLKTTSGSISVNIAQTHGELRRLSEKNKLISE